MASKYLKNLEVGEWFVRTAPNYVLQIKKTWETKGGKIDMRSALGEIYEDGVAIGEERGITIGKEYGISSMLELLQELGYCEDDAKFHLENKFQLSEQAADRYIKKYWNKK